MSLLYRAPRQDINTTTREPSFRRMIPIYGEIQYTVDAGNFLTKSDMIAMMTIPTLVRVRWSASLHLSE